MNRRMWTAGTAVAAIGAALNVMAPVTAAQGPKKATVVVVNLEIHSDQRGVLNTVLPDGERTVYRDYRLNNDRDVCVQGESYTHGLASVVMNRRMSEGGPLCGATGETTRTFRLRLENAEACSRLGEIDTPCTVPVLSAEVGHPHVRAETLFKSKVTSTAMTFFFAMRDHLTTDPDDIVHYRLTSDAPARVDTRSSDSKVVIIPNGTATLAQHFGHPGGYVEVVWNIPMRLSMKFDRVTAP